MPGDSRVPSPGSCGYRRTLSLEGGEQIFRPGRDILSLEPAWSAGEPGPCPLSGAVWPRPQGHGEALSGPGPCPQGSAVWLRPELASELTYRAFSCGATWSSAEEATQETGPSGGKGMLVWGSAKSRSSAMHSGHARNPSHPGR